MQFKRFTVQTLLRHARGFYGTCPAYLTNTVEFVGVGRTRSGLRSTSSTDFTLSRLSTKIVERAFPDAGHAAWNALPDDARCRRPISRVQKTTEDALLTG